MFHKFITEFYMKSEKIVICVLCVCVCVYVCVRACVYECARLGPALLLEARLIFASTSGR